MTTELDCPNCGAMLRHDGVTDLAHCTFCGTRVVIPRGRRAISRGELELERGQILARESESEAHLQRTRKRGAEDFLIPPAGCCGIYFGLFLVSSLILGVAGLKGSKEHTTTVAAIAITSALLGAVLIAWRREKGRKRRVEALERARKADLELRQKRLREIAAELDALGP